jgi:hypothetical protein
MSAPVRIMDSSASPSARHVQLAGTAKVGEEAAATCAGLLPLPLHRHHHSLDKRLNAVGALDDLRHNHPAHSSGPVSRSRPSRADLCQNEFFRKYFLFFWKVSTR